MRVGAKSFFLFMLSAILIFSPLARGAVRIWSISIVLLTEVFIIFLWLWRANNTNGYSFKRTKLDYPILALTILAIVSFIFSVYKHDSFYALLMLLGYIGIYHVIVNEFDHHRKRTLIWLIVSIGTVISGYGILQYFNIIGHSWWFPQQFLSSTYVNHNHFAGYLELVMPLAISMLIGAKISHMNFKLILVPMLVIMFFAFILAQSRGAWFSMTISLFVMALLFLKRGDNRLRNIILLVMIFAIAVTFIMFGKDVVSERLTSLTGPEGLEPSAETRFKIWRGTIDMIIHNPLIGCGIGDFIWVFPRYRPEGLDVTANFAHNDYLQAAAEMGLLAPLILLWMFVIVSFAVIKKEHMDPIKIGCAAGMLSLCIHGFVDFNFHIPANMLLFTVYAAIVMSTSRGYEEKGSDA
jgi:O-antigen ligase